MTLTFLQETLAEEIKKITNDLYFESISGEKITMNVFKQALPKKKNDDEDEPFPYVVVELVDGTMSVISFNDNNARVLIMIGILNTNTDNQGHIDVLKIIQRVAERFLKSNSMGEYVQIGNIEWALQDDTADTYPYYFGALNITFKCPQIERENEFT